MSYPHQIPVTSIIKLSIILEDFTSLKIKLLDDLISRKDLIKMDQRKQSWLSEEA